MVLFVRDAQEIEEDLRVKRKREDDVIDAVADGKRPRQVRMSTDVLLNMMDFVLKMIDFVKWIL